MENTPPPIRAGAIVGFEGVSSGRDLEVAPTLTASRTDEQFALFYLEKRAFFLEGAGDYSTPTDLLCTCTPADPSAALKVTGKQVRHTFGVLRARDEVTNLLVPGVDGEAILVMYRHGERSRDAMAIWNNGEDS